MLAIIFACLAGLLAAQQPRPCTSPPRWEGHIFASNEEQQRFVRGKISYDSIYRRLRVIEDIETGSEENFFDVITLADVGEEFVYNLKARNCTRRPMTRPWRDFGIAPDAHSYGEAYIGSSAQPDTNLLVTIWEGNLTTSGLDETIPYVGTWTYDGCLPVSHTIFSEKHGNEALSFFDLTLGIDDPSVFIPRVECLMSAEWENRHALFGTPAKKIE